MSDIDLNPNAARRSLSAVSDTVDISDDDVVERYSRVVWNSLAEPGDGIAGRIVDALGAAEALRRLRDGTLRTTPVTTQRELSEGKKRWMPRISAASVGHALELATVRRVRLVVPGDAE